MITKVHCGACFSKPDLNYTIYFFATMQTKANKIVIIVCDTHRAKHGKPIFSLFGFPPIFHMGKESIEINQLFFFTFDFKAVTHRIQLT